MVRILILADSRDYVRNNCFQMQLHMAFKANDSNCRLDYYFLSPKKLRNFETLRLNLKLNTYQFVVSTLRQRVLFDNLSFIQKLIGDLPLRVYDQDPWENYIDSSESNGCYTLLRSHFNLTDIFVTSNFWKDYIESNDKIKTTFVKMSMLPEICNTGVPQYNRIKTVEFRGSLHPHRKKAFDLMNQYGQKININVDILKYTDYLKYLQKLAIFVHDESGLWICNGKGIPMGTGIWHKDVEIASQGCFSIRNYHLEGNTYSMEKIPLVKFYNDPSEVKEIVNEIFSLSPEELDLIQATSVDHIKTTNHWRMTAKTILSL